VFENRVLRLFGLRREEVAGGWRRLHNEELHNLYASPNIIRVNKCRMRLAGYVVRERGMRTKFWSANLKVRHHFEDLGVDGMIILHWILEK
jgi:hypothetical protein